MSVEGNIPCVSGFPNTAYRRISVCIPVANTAPHYFNKTLPDLTVTTSALACPPQNSANLLPCLPQPRMVDTPLADDVHPALLRSPPQHSVILQPVMPYEAACCS